MRDLTGGCWQEAEFAKSRVMAAVRGMPGPYLPYGLSPCCAAAFVKADVRAKRSDILTALGCCCRMAA